MRYLFWIALCGAVMLAGCWRETLLTSCQETSDCPTGYHCDTNDHLCVADSDSGLPDAAHSDTALADAEHSDAALSDIAHGDATLSDAALVDTALADTARPDNLACDARRDASVFHDSPRTDTRIPDTRLPDIRLADTSIPDAGSVCETVECPVNSTCVDLADGGYECKCDGVVCDDYCYIGGRCCEDYECAHPSADCNYDHRCIVDIILQQGVNGYWGCTATYLDRYDDLPHPNPGHLTVHSDGQLGLLRFDLGAIPAGATVQQAGLSLYDHYREPTDSSVSVELGLYRALRAWDPLTATWTYASDSIQWNAAGCSGIGTDRSGNYSAVVAVLAGEQWYEYSVTDDVGEWVLHQSQNFGWVFRSLTTSIGVSDYFVDPYHITGELRPVLEIIYTEP